MHVEHHPLIAEFPEFREAIHATKQSDAHFARLFEAYEAVDKQICRVENGIEAMSDFAVEEIKKERLQLKDELYTILKDVDYAV